MIWYFLYPFRGTTEAPVLAPTHPLRSAFTRYGKHAARHVVSTLLISVTVAAILIYPFPFLFTTDFSNGASNLPHHVWTAAQPLGHRSRIEPDVIMRSIWVHGSYMKALDRPVLLGALELQDALLGPTKNFSPKRASNHVHIQDPNLDLTLDVRDTFHVINGLSNSSWFFHSPLQYWSCDPRLIESDEDIVSTVNQKKTQPTSVKVTLRHSIVFSGKRFEDRQLMAADAIVITLIHRRDSPVAHQWIRKAQMLARTMTDKWDVYPPDGISREPELYEFQFRPISTQDTIILALAYGLSFLYFMMSLSRLRAFKSKIGLMITVMVQIAVSVFSSFTVCAIFRVDLSRIPQAAYPVVVLSMSLENIFRLINAVISTPAEESVSARIGHAFGETAHIGLASSMQNVFILWGLSQITSSGVSEFCTFAAIAIVFDYFYLSTFFLSVLSVDVRRTELSDALAKATAWQSKNPSMSHQRPSWIDSVLHRRLALSTRIAGTIIMVGFVLIAQWHFFENEFLYRLFTALFNFSRDADQGGVAKESLLVDIHQARSPTSWLRLQDHDTAKEVINVIKPDAHSYIAEVYRPLVFVLKGSNREPDVRDGPLLPALYDFFHNQLTPFIVTVLVVIAAVRLLTNYLLWEEEMGSSDDRDNAEPLLSVKYLDGGHKLDVVMMTALSTSKGNQLVSVGLDRRIRVWDVRLGVRSYEITALRPPPEDPFPILAMTVDKDGAWLALLSTHRIFLWNLVERRWGRTLAVDLYSQKPEGFFFGNATKEGSPPLVIIRRNGTMTQLWPEKQETMDFVLCNTPIISAGPLLQKAASSNDPVRVVVASRNGCIHLATETGHMDWRPEIVKFSQLENEEAHQVLPLASLGAYLVVRTRSVDLIDLAGNVCHTFQTEAIQPRSVRCYHPAPRSATGNGGALGLTSFSLAYNANETSECVLHTFLPAEDANLISLGPTAASSRTCVWPDAQEVKKRIPNPGSWEMLANGCMMGVRKVTVAKVNGQRPETAATSGLRQRLGKSEGGQRAVPDAWEIWVVSRLGMRSVYETMALEPREDRPSGLMFTTLGPVVKVGTAAIAVAFGNDIRVISAGHDWSADDMDGPGAGAKLSLGRRMKRPGAAARPRLAI